MTTENVSLIHSFMFIFEDESPPIEETLSFGCLPKFVELLTVPHEQLQVRFK